MSNNPVLWAGVGHPSDTWPLYVIVILRRGETEEEPVTVAAPDFTQAILALASKWPGVQIVRFVGIAERGAKS